MGWLVFDRLLLWALVAAPISLGLALIFPGVLLPLNLLWTRLAGGVSQITNFVLLSTFFFLVIMPVGLVMRIFGADLLQRRRDPAADSYWSPLERHADADTFHDMF